MHLPALRQLSAEILAAALVQLFPKVLLIEGKSTEFGFYYDCYSDSLIDDCFLPQIEEKMREILKSEGEIRTLEMMRENAAALFEDCHQRIIAARVRSVSETIVPILQIGSFYDFCHLLYSGSKRSIYFKLFDVELKTLPFKKGKPLPIMRIHGTAAPEQQAFKNLLKSLNRAKKCDHRILGKDMKLYKWNPNATTLEWFWTPKGCVLRDLLLKTWQKAYQQEGFKLLSTPLFFKESFIKKAAAIDASPGDFHLICTESESFVPTTFSLSHAALFESMLPSYYELPLRYAECSKMFSPVKDGELWGVLNSRFTSMDCAHIFCTPGQLEKELISSLQFINKIIKMFGFETRWSLNICGQKIVSVRRPRHRREKDCDWEIGHKCLIAAFKACTLAYELIEEEDSGYPQKLSAQMHLIDAVGRELEGPQIEIDLNTPKSLKLHCEKTEQEEREQPFMIRLSLFGSIERFAILLLEHFAGELPLWLTPEQVRILPISQEHAAYAEEIMRVLRTADFRTEIDGSPDQLGCKIRKAASEKVPYLIVVGKDEEKDHLVTVRFREEVHKRIALKDFLLHLQEEVSNIPRKCQSGDRKPT